MILIEKFIYYSTEVLISAADFLVSSPMIYVVALGIMFFIAGVVKRMIS